jgi:hypothetical protein
MSKKKETETNQDNILTLKDMIEFKPGSKFLFRGEKAEAVWVLYEVEHLGEMEGKPYYSKDYGMYFTYGKDKKPVTIRTCWLSTDLKMVDFTKVD